MKPIKLKIKGLNSFIEEQTVDFEDLTCRGLFGIFGPTGSGKSTILDGITLALYGEVARKSSNYINTNCKALNVSFEFQISGSESKRYIVERQFKRDAKTGNPRAAGAKITDITMDPPEVLADKSTMVTKKCEEVIGLGLDDFTRTVVLPQGKFSEFLKLEGKTRRDMLERLFNLHNYGDNLAIKLSREIAKEKSENSVLLGQLKGYEEVSEDFLKTKNEALEVLYENIKNERKSLDELEKLYKENNELWNLQLELESYKKEEEILRERSKDIEKCKERISLGERALKLNPYIIAFENTLLEIEKTNKLIEELSKNLESLKKEKEEAEKRLVVAREKKDKELPELKIKEQRVRDAIEEKKLLSELEKEISSITIKINALRDDYKAKKKHSDALREEIESLTTLIKKDEESFESLKIDEDLKLKVQQGILLSEKHNGIQESLSKNKAKINSYEKSIEDASKERELLSKQHKEKSDLLNESKNNLENLLKNSPGEQKDLLELQRLLTESKEKWGKFNEASLKLQESEKLLLNLNKSVAEHKEKRKALEKELLNLREDYKRLQVEHLAYKLRSDLKNGEPCPVCGSLEHFKEHEELLQHMDSQGMEKLIEEKEKDLGLIGETIIREETNIANENEKMTYAKNSILELGEDFKVLSVDEMQNRFNELNVALEKYGKEKEALEQSMELLKDEINLVFNKITNLDSIKGESEKQLGILREDYEKELKDYSKLHEELDKLKKDTLVEDFHEKNKEILRIEKQREELSNAMKINRTKLEKLEKERAVLQELLNKIGEDGGILKGTLEAKNKNREEKIEALKIKVGEVEDLQGLLSKIKVDIENIDKLFVQAEEHKTLTDNKYKEINEKFIAVSSKALELNNRKVTDNENLNVALKNENFQSVSQVKESFIENAKIDELKENVEKYKEDLAKVKGNIETLLKKIDSRELSEEKWREIQELKSKKEEELKILNESRVKLEEEVKALKTKLQELADLLKKKEELDYKLGMLSDLEKLFKGKKFVEFVAASQLKYISIEASKKLKEITNNNYGLEVDENGKFIIRDYKNGGAERDASTLSGGETFLASLALALALSAQIQLKGTAPLELFFLDEGFGTLDDNLLEVVMGSLERIHNDKLKIGIISHVESIKNRVPVKLMITPAESGKGGSKAKIERS
ncbi:exonuclease SbcC [Clostridium collagenovorans DSM 3089]|uniref:Nuclease SbcCD subunit C n=1 Tax=Clostridium collagenovorans DSM 3089 TaxID=1121306 RepID=A0A1M5V753_9CLOT|nr:AAA family ATPase [Clostridium collagenovorans]SHH71055.1 exonuclease SbcC [Clostridium collagenovorans DSM 3089]